MSLAVLNDEATFRTFINEQGTKIVHFYATWAPSCEQTNVLLTDLLKEYKTIGAGYIDAEAVPKVSHEFKIAAAPTLVLFKNGKEAARVNGYIPAEIRQKITEVTMSTGAAVGSSAPTQDLNTRLKNLINSHKLMIFIKGVPEQPRCGFSRQLVELFKSQELDFGSFDILNDEEVRQGLKEFSNWPTYPQVYLNGELLGGLDVIREELADADFVKSLPKITTSNGAAGKNLNNRLKELINSHKLMIFIKGVPEQPRCGFSRQLVEIFKSHDLEFGSFDILEDEEVRQGLKEFSNWPTYPQVYLNGELLGGLDVIREEFADADFVKTLPKKG